MSLYADRLFPWLMDRALGRDTVDEARSRLLGSAGGHVLEVGFGTGLNLIHYPDGLKSLTAVEPSAGMRRVARQRIRHAHFPVDLRAGDASNLALRDHSYDCVVSSFTLCSVPDPAAVLAEIRRVLKPDGRFLFLEHGLSDQPRLARWQRRLTPVQRRIACGCHLDRSVSEDLVAAGFTLSALTSYRLEGLPRLAAHMFEGTAIPRR